MRVFGETLERTLANMMIVAMLFWMLFWDSEASNPIRRYWIPKIQKVFIWLGLNAEWRMFSPDPPRRDIWPMAKLTIDNCNVVHWEPTPYGELTVLQKIRFKKLHKYYHEVVRVGSGQQIKRDFVEYLLRKGLHRGPCTKVELYRVVLNTRSFGAPEAELPAAYKQLIFTFHPIPS
jgi:hypothetical protein